MILITGGAGYLGSVLVRKLLEGGYKVRVLDNFLFGKHPLNSIKDNNNLELVEGDIRDMKIVVKALNDADAAIHLASIVGDQASDLDPRTTIEVNYIATKNIAELCELYQKKFLFTSTCSVYGERSTQLMTENSRLIKPISLYGQTKLKSEIGIKSVNNNYIIFRLGTLFGLSPRMRFDLAINLFTAKGVAKEPLTVFGGDQWRPFIHVQDATDAIITAIKKDWRGAFNISWENLQIKDVAKIIGESLGVPVEFTKKITDRRNYRVACTKAKKLGFKPRRTIDDAIKEIKNAFEAGTIKNYRDYRYANEKTLFQYKSAQKKLFTIGPIHK